MASGFHCQAAIKAFYIGSQLFQTPTVASHLFLLVLVSVNMAYFLELGNK